MLDSERAGDTNESKGEEEMAEDMRVPSKLKTYLLKHFLKTKKVSKKKK